MDINMPEMDGIAATREIRALPGGKGRIPIIAVTANAIKNDREQYLDAGMDDYVTKPIDGRRLSEAIARQSGVGLAAKAVEKVPRSAENEAE